MSRRFSLAVAALSSSLLVTGCVPWSGNFNAIYPTSSTSLDEIRLPVESQVIEQQLLIDPGQSLLLELPRQQVRVLERQTLEMPQHNTEVRDIPWANQPVQVQLRKERLTMYTDANGFLELNLLKEPLARVDILNARRLKLKARMGNNSEAELVLPVSPVLRGRLHEVLSLIYDELEGGDVTTWVARIQRLQDLNFPDEAQALQQTLLDLTRNDPELHQQLRTALRL